MAASDIGAYEFQYTPEVMALLGVKTSPGETIVRCNEAIVSAAWPDFFYIEADDRTCGIRADKAGHLLQVGMRADVIGYIRTNADGELYVDAATALQNGIGDVTPLAMVGLAVGGSDFFYDPGSGSGQQGASAYRIADLPGGGSGRALWALPGLNNIGLLVKIWGTVTWAGTDTFYVDDGSGYDDGDPDIPGVLVTVPAGVDVPPEGSMVQVAGASSCYSTPDGLRRLLRVRTSDDIVVELE